MVTANYRVTTEWPEPKNLLPGDGIGNGYHPKLEAPTCRHGSSRQTKQKDRRPNILLNLEKSVNCEKNVHQEVVQTFVIQTVRPGSTVLEGTDHIEGCCTGSQNALASTVSVLLNFMKGLTN